MSSEEDVIFVVFFFFSSRRRHTRFDCDWSSDVCSSDLGYTVSETSVQSGTGARVQLQFPTRTGVKYEVLFRQSLAGAGVVVPFATTIGGAATATVLTGNNAAATLFVDRTSDAGFYSIAVQVNPG